MRRRENDPSGGEPITAEWDGSLISIYDLDGILGDAHSLQGASLYDRSDFAFPIERIQVIARADQVDDEQALALRSSIQMDRTDARIGSSEWLNQRFASCLTSQQNQSRDYQRRPPFRIVNTVFMNTYGISDDENGVRFILWIDHDDGCVRIGNDEHIFDGMNEERLGVRPKPFSSIPPQEQLKSLLKVTALVADFVNSFDEPPASNRARGVPLKREYIVGKERRILSDDPRSRDLGSVSVRAAGASQDDRKRSRRASPDSDLDKPAPDIDRVKPDEAISLSDIGGLERVKNMLRDVATSFKHPEVMEKWGAKRPQGVLLYGEPGTGKTMLAQALANEIGAEMWAIQSTDIYEKWLGNSEDRMKAIFDKIRQADTPLIVFFDEFESIVGLTKDPSSGGGDNARNAVAGIFKQEMNTLAKENPNILVVAATNDLDLIDPSLVRSGRFDHKIYVPMPDQAARQEIASAIVAKTMFGQEETDFKVFADDLDITQIAELSDGFSGADISEIFRRIGLARAMEEARRDVAQPPITQAEIKQEIENFRQNG